MNSDRIISELERIAAKNGGDLRPVDVVRAARPKTSPLHSRFLWDNDKAGDEYRLWQARELIRVTVRLIGSPDDGLTVSRVFVSLSADRKNSGGGYRSLVSVMDNETLRKQLLADAYAEMERFQQKYEALKELAEVFAAMRRAKKHTIAA
jgi:hypothetical protein